MQDETQSVTQHIVLLVDDSPGSLRMLVDALEAAGMTALVARDGASALGLLDRITPDLILMDAVMPGLDGFDTCVKIKARTDFALTPIIFMTGLSDTDHIVRGLRAGGVDYLTKPIDQNELIARIETHIANATMMREARSALDSGRRGVAALRPDGTLAWASPRAATLLGPSIDALGAAERDGLVRWLSQTGDRPVGAAFEIAVKGAGGRALLLSYLSRAAHGDLLVGVLDHHERDDGIFLSAALGVSKREGEVLSWLAKGKSTKDIAAILDLSARTVAKHLEQIYVKLGVENRTAAAAVALRHLSS